MQASKIYPDMTYAVRRSGVLVRFRVTEVVTRRQRATGSPHDYKSEVAGFILATDRPHEENRLTLKPDEILGEYKAYAELVEREAAETAERKRKEAARDANREKLLGILYAKTGLTMPEEEGYGVRKPFRANYSGIDISDEGVNALLAYLMEASRG